MIEDTPEQKKVIRQRQMNCKHSFIRGACDREHRCPRCGVGRAEWEAMSPPTLVWGGIP